MYRIGFGDCFLVSLPIAQSGVGNGGAARGTYYVPLATTEAALDAAKIDTLPRLPDGKHIIADLMSFYFGSSEGYDLCYRAAIGRDRCRGLEGSDNPPPPLKGIA